MRINRENIAEQDIIRPSTSPSQNNNYNKSPLANKLQQLEQKQYELTKKQLAFAQRNNSRNKTKSDPTLASIDYKSSNYKDTDSMASIDDSNTVSSSIKSENLRDIWKLLDHESNFDDEPFKQGNNNNNSSKKDPFEPAIKVTSMKPIKHASKSPRNTKQPMSARENKPKPKIRNYNIKD